jgi:hypothetical protein
MWCGRRRRNTPHTRLVPQPANPHVWGLSMSGDTPYHTTKLGGMWEFLLGVGYAPMLHNSRHPTDAAGQRPTHRRTWHETSCTRRSLGRESYHSGATPGPAAPLPRIGRTDRGWCARSHHPITVVAFQSRDEPGSPRRWCRWSSA